MWEFFDDKRTYRNITYTVCYDGLVRDNLINHYGIWHKGSTIVDKSDIFRIFIPAPTNSTIWEQATLVYT